MVDIATEIPIIIPHRGGRILLNSAVIVIGTEFGESYFLENHGFCFF